MSRAGERMDGAGCAVLVPVAREVEFETDRTLHELANLNYAVRYLRGGSQVDLVRSALASAALRDGFAETLWVDADQTFTVADVERLRLHNLPLVAGLYPKKGRPEFAGKFRDGTTSVKCGTSGGLLEMQYVGMGLTLIRAKVYEKIAAEFALPACSGNYDPGLKITPYFLPMVVPENGGHCYLSEDYSFCYRARQAGIAIMADTTIRVGHIHRTVLTWDDFVPRQRFDGLEMGFEGLTAK